MRKWEKGVYLFRSGWLESGGEEGRHASTGAIQPRTQPTWLVW